MPSAKTQVIEYLFSLFEAGHLPDGIVTNENIVAAITATQANLKTNNPANFLKDIIRSANANAHWPLSLKEQQITARQRYGANRVFQFVPYTPGQEVPFPDHCLPNPLTATMSVQSASIPFAARQLGRLEETWLTQIVVNLRLIESQLSIFSPLRHRLRDVTHLQMGMKTQPEIDAVYLASFDPDASAGTSDPMHILICCEAKQLRERLLDDQIREQVAKCMQITGAISTPTIAGVKPMAIKVVEHQFAETVDKGVYIVEFEHFERSAFYSQWGHADQLYGMPLIPVSQTIYKVTPPIAGLNAVPVEA